jgi:ribosome maturation protein Sdo1
MARLIPLEELKKALEADAAFRSLPISQKEQLIQRLEGMAVDPRYRGMVPADILKRDLEKLRLRTSDRLDTSTVEKAQRAIKPLIERGPGLRKIGGK